MVVGICRVSLFIPGSRSLKDRRRAVQSVKQKLRNEFNLSAAEVDDEGLWQRATLGLAVVASDGRFADQVMAQALDLIRRQGDIELMDYQTEVR
jgi:hypothetical protein